MVIGVVCWIVLGVIAGFVAITIVRLRNDDPSTYLLGGVVGAVVGGGLFNGFSVAGALGFNLWSVVAAACGAAIVLVLWHAARVSARRPQRRRT